MSEIAIREQMNETELEMRLLYKIPLKIVQEWQTRTSNTVPNGHEDSQSFLGRKLSK
jgi:hypothetical protein